MPIGQEFWEEKLGLGCNLMERQIRECYEWKGGLNCYNKSPHQNFMFFHILFNLYSIFYAGLGISGILDNPS